MDLLLKTAEQKRLSKMLYNTIIKNKSVTIDTRLYQIRVVSKKGINFIPLSHNDIDGYEYLISENQEHLIAECLKEVI